MSNYSQVKCLLVVNVATKWGLTKEQYTQLTALHNKYNELGFQVLAFPCNQFMGQEPGTEAEIKHYVTSTYDSKFPLFAKIDVNGPNTHPIYQFLRQHSSLAQPDGKAKQIPWNFAKFIIQENGTRADFFLPTVKPFDMEEQIKRMVGAWWSFFCKNTRLIKEWAALNIVRLMIDYYSLIMAKINIRLSLRNEMYP